MFCMLSIPLVNDSELHDQSHFEDLVCGSGLHGRQHTPMLLARSPILTISTHAASRNLICGLTSDLHLGMWHLPRESVSDAGSHLKKSLTIKSSGKGWLKMVAEQHGSSITNWNSNVFSCVAVSSLISSPLSGKDLTWDSNNADNVLSLLTETVNRKHGFHICYSSAVPHVQKRSYCIHRTRSCLSVMARFTRCTPSGPAVRTKDTPHCLCTLWARVSSFRRKEQRKHQDEQMRAKWHYI